MNQLQRSERVVLFVVGLAVLGGGIAPTLNTDAVAAAILYDGAALAAAGFALVGAFRLPPGRRTEWIFLASGCFCFFVGDVVRDFYERILDQPVPLPSLADAVYLSAYPLIVLAVLRLVRRRTDVDALNVWLDVGVLAMAVGLLVWEPLLVDSGRSFSGALVAGAYPVFDIVLLAFAITLAGNRRTTQSTLLVAGGAGTLFIADLTYLVLESRGRYASGGFPDPLFVVGTFLLAAAPWFDDPDIADDPTQRRRSRPVASTALVIAALTALPIDFGLTPDSTDGGDGAVVRMLLRILLLAFVALRLLRQAARNEELVTDLDRTSTRLATVIENTADAVVFVNPVGEILEWNATAESLFGFRRDEVLGSNVLSLFERAENAEAASSIMRSLAHGGTESITLQLAPQGQPMAIGLQISGVTDADGALIGYVSVARDDTRRILANHALQSFAQLQPDAALRQFAEHLAPFAPFDVLSLATVDDNWFGELARVSFRATENGRVLEPTPPAELLHGPILEALRTRDDRPYLIVRAEDWGTYRNQIVAADVNETIALPLRDPLSRELRGVLGLGFREPGGATVELAESLARITPELSHSVNNMILYERERRSSERLQELDDLREGFFALVAHEVRSPLGAIGTAASVLRDHGASMDSDAARDLAAGITTSARRLARLTGDLVDASRGGDGAFPCQLQPISDLAAIVHTAATAAAGEAAARLRLCTAPGVAVTGDADRLAQVVTNLVTNALKFSPAAIDVTLAVVHGQAELRVVDHGSGVPSAHAHRLFQRYTRLPVEGDGPRPSGSGLGLFITHELVAAHGGTLAHEPTPGGGATFVLRLPLAVEDAPS